MKIKNFIFGTLFLCALLIPTSAFASTGDTTTTISYSQNTSQSLIDQVLSFFGLSTTNNNGTSISYTSYNKSGVSSNNNYGDSNCNYTKPPSYTESDCNGNQPPPCESNDVWSRWYCGGGQWGSF